MPTLTIRAPLPTPELLAALALRDLADPAQGPHAMQLLLAEVIGAVSALWPIAVELHRPSPIVTVADNYDDLGYAVEDVTRDARYTRYLSDDVMLRSHTSAAMPALLRGIARRPRPLRSTAPVPPDALDRNGHTGDVLLAVPGLCHRRDAVDRLHVGTPHQLDLWRVTDRAHLTRRELRAMAAALVGAVLPDAEWRVVDARHPYTVQGWQLDVLHDGEWVELAECGIVASGVLRRAGLDPRLWTGLALGMGLDRALMLRKGVPDIRMLRARDPRIAGQMGDLSPWRPVSMRPPVRRDLSIVLSEAPDVERLGDLARSALGDEAEVLESVELLASTPAEELTDAARERLRIGPGGHNALVRLTLRPLDRSLTDAAANVLRDRVYHAVHEGEVLELIG